MILECPAEAKLKLKLKFLKSMIRGLWFVSVLQPSTPLPPCAPRYLDNMLVRGRVQAIEELSLLLHECVPLDSAYCDTLHKKLG